MSDRVPLRPAGDVRDPQLSLAGIRPAQVPGAAPPGSRVQGAQPQVGVDVLAGQVLGFVGDRLVKQEVERAVDAAKAEPLQRDGQNNLIVPDMERSFWDTPSDEAARAVRVSRYGSEWVLGQQAALVQLRAENNTPEGFAVAAGKWRDATVQRAPAAIRAIVGEQLDTLIGQHGRNLAERAQSEARAASLEAAGQLITQWVTEADDLIRGGREREAQAPDGPMSRALAKVREQVGLGIIPPALGLRMEREIGVVGPITAHLMREVSRNPANSGAVVEALRVGPGHAAWNPAWATLSPQERDSAARMAAAVVQARRGEQDYQRGEARRSDLMEQSRLAFELNDILKSIKPGEQPNDDQKVAIARITGRMRELSERQGDTRGLAAQGTLEALQERAGQHVLNQDRVDRLSALLQQAAENVPGAKDKIDALYDKARDLSLPQKAELFQREAAAYGPLLQQQAQLIQQEAEFHGALHNQRPRVANNEVYQGIADRLIRAEIARSQEPGAPPRSPVDIVVSYTRAGALPQRYIEQLRAGVETGVGLESAAALHAKMQADPQAKEVYDRAVPDNIRAALDGMATLLAPLRPDNPDDARTRESLRAEALLRMQGRKFTNAEAVMATFGKTEEEQRRNLEKAIDDAWKVSRLEKGGYLIDRDAAMPLTPEMRDQMRAYLLANMRHWGAPFAAGREAARQVSQGWTYTAMGLPLRPGAAGTRLEPGDPVLGAPVVRHLVPVAQAPEQFVALHGKADTDKAPDAEWIRDRLPALVKQAGGATDRLDATMLGGSLKLMPVAGQEGQFFVWQVDEKRQLRPISRVVNGVESTDPVVVDLRAEAARLTREWRERRVNYVLHDRANTLARDALRRMPGQRHQDMTTLPPEPSRGTGR